MDVLASRRITGVALGVVLLAGATAQAGFSSYDFEGQDVATGLSTITVDNNGLALTITRTGGTLGVTDFSAASATTTLGSRTVIPEGDGAGPLIVNFSTAVNEFSAQLGDFGDDTDDLTLIAYSGPDGTGSVVDTATAQLPPVGTLFSSQFLTVSGASIGSVSLLGGSGDNSVAYDNFAASAVPLPPAILAAAPLLGAMAVKRLRRKA